MGPADQQERPRRAWLAALLSVVPGLGHLYAGLPWSAIGWLAAGVAVSALAVLFFRIGTLLVWVSVLLLSLAFRVGVAISAWRAVRTARPGAAWLRGLPLLLACVVFLVASQALGDWELALLKRHVVEAFKIPSGSMEPTLLIGDYILAAPLKPDDLRRDQPVIRLDEDDVHFVTRVVGLPGDTLSMRESVLFRNGRTVAEPYAHNEMPDHDPRTPEMLWQRAALPKGSDSASYVPALRNWGPLVVPAGQSFVLGDNRDNSLDSRYIGFIPIERVVKRPLRIYFSADPETGARWTRIGRSVDD